MLKFEPSTIQIGGDTYTVYPDTLNPFQWYYLPLLPRVAQIGSKLQLQLIKYRAGAGEEGPKGGWLILTVDLSLPDETKQQLQTKLQRQQNLSDIPTLSPPLWIGGRVELMVLNRSQSVQPALVGNSQASFSVQLTPEEASLLEKTLESGKPPLGIAYGLDYEAIRPAYKFQIEAEWDRVQTYLEQRFQAGLILFSLDITNVVETLEEKKYIKVRLENYDTDDSRTKARNIALQEIEQMLLSQFFAPAFGSINPEAEVPPRFGFRRVTVDIKQVQKRSLNLTMSTRVAVQRRAFPQGIGAGWPQTPEALAPYVRAITLDDTYFKDRRVEVLCLANFETDNIAQIKVTLQYGNQKKELVFFTATIGSKTVSWASLKKTDGTMERDVTVSYQVIFKVVDGNQWPTLESPPEVTTNDHWVLDPCQLYRIQPIRMGSLNDFPWSKYGSVLVELQYRDAPNNPALARVFNLTADNPERDWKLLMRPSQKQQFQYKITYVSRDRHEFPTPWKTTGESLIAYDEFLPQEKTLRVVSALTWSNSDSESEPSPETPIATKAYVSLEGKSLTFTADKHNPQSLTIALTEEHPIFKYSVHIQFQRSPTLNLKYCTQKSVLLLSPNMKACQVVTLSTGNTDFPANKIKEVRVTLRYLNAEANLKTEKQYQFFAPDEYDYFEYKYEDSSAYQWQIATTIADDVLGSRTIYFPGPKEDNWGTQTSQQFNLFEYIRLDANV